MKKVNNTIYYTDSNNTDVLIVYLHLDQQSHVSFTDHLPFAHVKKDFEKDMHWKNFSHPLNSLLDLLLLLCEGAVNFDEMTTKATINNESSDRGTICFPLYI